MMKDNILIALNYSDLFLKFIKKRVWRVVNLFTIYVLATPRIHKIIARSIYNSLPKNIKNQVKASHCAKKILSKFIPSSSGPRKYIKSGLSIGCFFKELNNRNCRYVILRWWENLPVVEKGEDIDIIIFDEDCDKISDLMTSDLSGQKLDIYTINGTKGGDYNDIPYFKINLSEDMIANRILYKEIFYVPSTEYYFYSLAYHAIFHKGSNSHLNGFSSSPTEEPEHNYSEFLKNMSKKMSLDIDINVKNIMHKLKENRYYPSYDLLMKLIDLNSSIRDFLPLLRSDVRGGELALIIIREQAVLDGLSKDLKHIIEYSYRINIIRAIQLNEFQQDLLSKEMRGANWMCGPYRKSGGPPSIAYIVYDYHPQLLNESLQDKYPWFTNINLLKCKQAMRNTVFNSRSIFHHYNAVHSTDNEQEANYFVKLLLSEDESSKIEYEIEEIRENYKGKHKVVRELSRGSRSKVELIKFNEKLAVKKTFKHTETRFLEREIYASEVLSKNNKYIVELLEKGDNYLITKYYDNVLLNMSYENKKILMRKNKYKLVDAITNFYDSGYAHINLTTGNILMTRDEKLKVIDFEFLYKYKNKPNKLSESFDVVGVPFNFDSDLPMGYLKGLNSFNREWSGYVGKFDINLKEVVFD